MRQINAMDHATAATILNKHGFSNVCADIDLYDRYGYWASDVPEWFKEMCYEVSLFGINEQGIITMVKQWIDSKIEDAVEKLMES